MRLSPIVMVLALLPAALALGQTRNYKGQSLMGSPRADFTDVDCAGASFEAASLYSPQFIRTNLRGANFRGCTVYGGSFALADLSGADFTDANLSGASLADAKNLGKAIFHHTRLRTLQDADLTGADLHGLELSQVNFVMAKLRGARLSHCNLTQADFSHADLREADLSSCQLTQADFRGADLRGADLTGATMTQAMVDRADLSTAKGLDANAVSSFISMNDGPKLPPEFQPQSGPEATPRRQKTLEQLRAQPDMYGTDLRQMDLHGADLHELRMQGSLLPDDLRDANFQDANATSLVAEHADFSGANLQDANLASSWLIGAKLSEAKNLGSAKLASCRLDRCLLNGANGPGIKLNGAVLRGANLTGAKLAGADLSSACLLGANLQNADLSHATLGDAVVAGANFLGANLAGVDASRLGGLTQGQLDQMAQKPKLLPERLDPIRRAIIADGGNPDNLSSGRSPFDKNVFIPGWPAMAVLRTKVFERLGIAMALVIVLTFIVTRGETSGSFGLNDRWQNIVGPHIALGSRAGDDRDMQLVGRSGVRIWPSLDRSDRELPLPMRIEKPAKVGAGGVRVFILINGLILALLIASMPISVSLFTPLIGAAIWLPLFLVWGFVLLLLRGRLIAADRSVVVLATLKAANPSAAAKTKVLPTSSFTAVSWYFRGVGESSRNLELTTGGFAPTVIPLGIYPMQQAFEIRQRVAHALQIADRDERREQSSD